MRFRYDERKAAEAAAHLLNMAGGTMYHIQLVKLIYLADRTNLIETGFTITGDRLVSMPLGPVPSATLTRIHSDPRPGDMPPWFEYVSPPINHQVNLQKAPPEDGRLSDFEIDMLQRIYRRFGRMDRFALVDLTHDLPEWQDPHGSSIPIEPEVILRAAGKTEAEIEAMTAEAEHQYRVEEYAQ
jgi:uncharacterized phage-associated protein